MKIALKDQVVKQISGETMKRDGNDLTLKDVILDGLLGVTEASQKMDSTEKIRRSTLAEMIYRCEEVDLPAEDVALIKKVINEVFPQPWIVHSAYNMIEPKTEDIKG